MLLASSGLPRNLDLVKSQILASEDIPSLSEVFSRLRHATWFDSSTAQLPYPSIAALPFDDKYAFATSIGSSRGGHGGWGHGVKAVDVVSKGKGVVVEDVAHASALIVMVRIIR